MDKSTIIKSVQTLLAPWAERYNEPEEGRIDIYLPAEKNVAAVKAMVDSGVWHLSAITGMDIPQTMTEDGSIELLYHFCQKSVVATLRIKVSYGYPYAQSICGVIPAAVLYEAEAVEMFGVILEGIPMNDHLLLPDDWPDWVYPLRKSFKGLE
jgi:NADH:ubiquinone oxidoreductase subunit C